MWARQRCSSVWANPGFGWRAATILFCGWLVGSVFAPSAVFAATGDHGELPAAPAVAEAESGQSSGGETEEPEIEPEVLGVEGAVLRWGINNECNNRAAAPSTFNLFSAGKLGDPGQVQVLDGRTKGRKWGNGKVASWRPEAGNVRLEKARADGTYGLATWAGTQTTRAGEPLGGYATNTRFSDHQLVFRQGSGEVDLEAGSAEIGWQGDATIIYYSGMSFFYLSDPVLRVRDGAGQLTATVSGYLSRQEDMSKWQPVKPRAGVVLANFDGVDLSGDGFAVLPEYLGVRVSGVDQNNSVENAGSFPQSFIDVLTELGPAGYWHSTGGSLDRNKIPLELGVSYSEEEQVVPRPPDPVGPERPVPSNSAPPPPEPTESVTPRANPQVPPATAPAPMAAPPVAPAPPVALPFDPAAASLDLAQGQGRSLAQSISSPASTVLPASRPAATSRVAQWAVLGAALLVFLLACSTAVTALFVRPTQRR